MGGRERWGVGLRTFPSRDVSGKPLHADTEVGSEWGSSWGWVIIKGFQT
jgi:hypothetical protein